MLARRVFRAFTSLLLAAGLLLGALMVVPALFGIQRYVIVSGSMTGTYDRGSVVFDQVVPVASLKVGDVITYRPPAGAGPDHLVTHRIAAITTDAARHARVPHQGRRQRGRRPVDVHAAAARTRRASAPASRTSASPSPRSSDRRVRMLVIGLPAALIALTEPRRPVARERRRGRRSPHVKRALLALAVLAALIPFRIGSSNATFVAASANPERELLHRRRLQHRRGLARRPGHAAARHRRADRRPRPRTAASRA